MLDTDTKRRIDTARDILTSLSSPTYAPRNPRFAAMLQHGTQHLPKGWADSPDFRRSQAHEGLIDGV